METTTTGIKITCYHCGDPCLSTPVTLGEKAFCCEGCKTVYQLLDHGGLCEYYRLNDKPGVPRTDPGHKDKFAFLADEKIAGRFVIFRDDRETHARFYLPQIHCSSCLFLLENLHRLDAGVISSRVDFAAREVAIVFNHHEMNIRQLAELLSATGYEPYISLRDLGQSRPPAARGNVYRLGIAGFCFANIMLMSFPEYLGLEGSEPLLRSWFRMLNLALAIPVFFYSAQPFYRSAWKGLRNKFLNIDAPIALAIIVTFIRSAYEVLSGTGAGYFDSMTGIVFFMLAGRALQDRTQRRLSFERDYTSYFPIAVSLLQDGKEVPRTLPEIRCGDTLVIHHGELIPADGIITRGQALIDYSFVTGESLPVAKELGELVYAGGRQTGPALEILVVKEVAQSYLTQLWNRHEEKKEEHSYIHLLSRWFTYIVLTIATGAAIYWWIFDPARIAGAVTAVLIVACPCALLLSSTFTNGNILRILGNNGLYLRNARVIENIAATTHIVFDKTGTLTTPGDDAVTYEGSPLTPAQLEAIAVLAAQSTHPLSKALTRHLGRAERLAIAGFRESPGKGVEGWIDGQKLSIGSRLFVTGLPSAGTETRVYVAWNNQLMGHFRFSNHYRDGIPALVQTLGRRFRLSLLSGDNDRERSRLQAFMGRNARIFFNRTPEKKAAYISQLQQLGEKVMMIGDGLNDAGALRQSDTGIALAEDHHSFTPSSHAILEASRLQRLPQFIRFCRMAGRIILASFILSILYNVIGLSFAVRGQLSPLIAAILMPSSSLSILILTYSSVNWAAKYLGFNLSPPAEKDHASR
ncbi:heavy metal translocating P-type ATPase metal-binding domain-containing protein [Flavitalea sp. BT771]|uniref:heavy metal translocating P-type ATPase n=1 Tax=Flavitalea sp. BT771 TaxID=3063329 RepID=UPI0026E40778|nr:heavy metal translocating P-type ATPase metal-binding domain-containing protein [Flavitalea sp. BT771]MDO6429473.1 heavy metal translocating P-type ATPase metal-binding domain-containing protein [Flavitalea sp. BT771]MDV6218399.1 heavy metal translocating P-type ATPase metal-binding domain-containing protein [Flavitalea sp. BT771]